MVVRNDGGPQLGQKSHSAEALTPHLIPGSYNWQTHARVSLEMAMHSLSSSRP